MTLRDSCECIVTASQAPFRQLDAEARSLAHDVAAGVLDVHTVWHELMVAAVLAGIPARSAATIIREGLQGTPPTIEHEEAKVLP